LECREDVSRNNTGTALVESANPVVATATTDEHPP